MRPAITATLVVALCSTSILTLPTATRGAAVDAYKQTNLVSDGTASAVTTDPNLKFPSNFRGSMAYDRQLPGAVVATFEGELRPHRPDHIAMLSFVLDIGPWPSGPVGPTSGRGLRPDGSCRDRGVPRAGWSPDCPSTPRAGP